MQMIGCSDEMWAKVAKKGTFFAFRTVILLNFISRPNRAGPVWLQVWAASPQKHKSRAPSQHINRALRNRLLRASCAYHRPERGSMLLSECLIALWCAPHRDRVREAGAVLTVAAGRAKRRMAEPPEEDRSPASSRLTWRRCSRATRPLQYPRYARSSPSAPRSPSESPTASCEPLSKERTTCQGGRHKGCSRAS